MLTISKSEGLVRLSPEEQEAISQVDASTIGFNVIGGFRLAAALHKGKVRAAEMAGIMHTLFRDSIEDAGRVINDGDLVRGRLLAERNFVDGDAISADNAITYGNLNELYRAAKNINEPESFVPLTADNAGDMSDSDLTMWAGVMSASLDVLLNEQSYRRGKAATAMADGASLDNDLSGAEESLAVVRNRKAKTARAAKSQRRTAQAAKKTRKPKGRKPRGK